MNNKQLGRKLLEIEQLLNSAGLQPSSEPDLDAKLDKLLSMLDESSSKQNELTHLFKEILSLKKGTKPDQSAIMRLMHKLF